MALAAKLPCREMSGEDLAGKRVLIREDLNVPISAGRVTNDARLVAALPTLRQACDAGAAVLVMSHLGRPKEGVFDEAFSLAPVAARLAEMLGCEVPLIADWQAGVAVQPGAIVLLENVRFLEGEKKDAAELAKRLAGLCDIFVMDAFATAHRAQASTHGVARYAPIACAGPLLVAELSALEKALAELFSQRAQRHGRGHHPVIEVDLTEAGVSEAQQLRNLIKEHRLDRSIYGVFISLVTDWDIGGVDVPAHITDIVRLGGQLEFSLEIV